MTSPNTNPLLRRIEMGYNRRGVRDGSGPYKGSYQRRVAGGIGRRRQAGQACPYSGRRRRGS